MAGSSCRCDSQSTIMHEFMHAIGVKQEHARPDREEWLNVDLDQTEMDSQFTLIADLNWNQIVDGNGEGLYPYETASGLFSQNQTCRWDRDNHKGIGGWDSTILTFDVPQ